MVTKEFTSLLILVAHAMVEPTGELSSLLTVANIIACLRKLGPHIVMFSEVAKLLELLLLLPVISATAERSFSGLVRCLKTFLRTGMSHKLLNSLAGHTPCPQTNDA